MKCNHNNTGLNHTFEIPRFITVIFALCCVAGCTENSSVDTHNTVCPAGENCSDPKDECLLDTDCANRTDGKTVCSYDTFTCTEPTTKIYCGDGITNGNENCDGNDLNHKSCTDLSGFVGGTLRCNTSCQFDTSGCVQCTDSDLTLCQNNQICNAGRCTDPANANCGNGSIDENEACDGSNLNQKKCSDFPEFVDGSLSCNALCKFDTSGCVQCTNSDLSLCQPNQICNNGHCVDPSEYCGDGTVNNNENCDGSDLNHKSCSDLPGFDGGTLSCNASCNFDTSACHPDDSQNCDIHPEICTAAQVCQNGTCHSKPCTYSSDFSKRSPSLCVDNHLLVCSGTGYYREDTSIGTCTEQNPCTICPDGFAGCTNDEATFCKDHRVSPDGLPYSCIQNVYPPMCVKNSGYMCGANGKYYNTSATRCSGSDECVLCQSGYIGCSSDPEAFCSERNSQPVIDSNTCQTGHRRCNGTQLMECDGTSYSKLVENCSSYCKEGRYGNNATCSSLKPHCEVRNGSYARIVGWNDGDTVVVIPESIDGSCYSDSDDDRTTIRVYHIDSPECSKKQNYNYGVKTCFKDYNYTSTNDPYGYNAWEASKSMADKGTIVQLFCDNTDANNNCPTDANYRYLAYVSANGLDVSTELTRRGLAIPSLGRTPVQSDLEKQICIAFLEAVENHRYIWSECTTADAQCVRDSVAALPSTRAGEFDYIYERCEYISKL